MATMILGTVGSAVGGALIPGGAFGGLISGAQIGGFIGATIGQQIDNALLSPSNSKVVEGPRLSDLKIQASTEGAAIMRVYGRMRIAGQIIWASEFKENVTTTTHSGGGGGGKFSGPSSAETTTKEYSYSISFAVGLAEGAIDRIGRVWADGKPMKLSEHVVRFYKGTEWQNPDSVIEAIEGAGKAPAYRGLSYVVFEDLDITAFGNRIPQLTFEVYRSIPTSDDEALENLVTAVDMIPASGEFAYSTEVVLTDLGQGNYQPLTMNNNMGASDFSVSTDMLSDQLPNVGAVALVVSWVGDDLRCNHVKIKPSVEIQLKDTLPYIWNVDGVTRLEAHLVSQIDGRPALGGTPSDAAVVEAIQSLKARGFKVLFYPFILMDVPSDTTLPDPYNSGSTQPPYPWRGRITCDPAPGVAGSPDQTATAATQVNAFFGSAGVGDFSRQRNIGLLHRVNRLGVSPHDPPLRALMRGRGWGGCVFDRLGNAGANLGSKQCRELSGGHPIQNLGGRCLLHSDRI